MRSRVLLGLSLAALPLLVTGCVLFEPARWRDFTGPSWDIPIAVPLLPNTRFDLGKLESIANRDNEIGFHYPLDTFAPPELTFNKAERIAFQGATVETAQGIEVSVAGLADLPDVQILTAELIISVENAPALTGKVSVHVAALSGGAETARAVAEQDLTDGGPLRIDLGSLLNGSPRPDRLRLHYVIDIPAQWVHVQQGDRVAVAAELWAPLYVHMPSEPLRIEPGGAIEIALDGDAKAALFDARLVDLALVVDVVSRSPVGMDVELRFAPEATPGADAVSVFLQVPNGVVDPSGRAVAPARLTREIHISEELRQLLVGERVFMTARLALYNDEAGPDGIAVRFTADDHVTLRGYAVVTVGVNRG